MSFHDCAVTRDENGVETDGAGRCHIFFAEAETNITTLETKTETNFTGNENEAIWHGHGDESGVFTRN